MAQKFLTDIEVTRGLVDSDGDLGVAGQVLSSTGTGTNWITNEANSTVVYQDGFTGDNSTVDFTLSVSVTDENVTQVYIDGVYQNKDTYSVSNTTLTFSTAPPLNADIEVITFSTATTADDLQAGVMIIPVKNTHTASIAKGEPVYITGNVGSSARLQIAPADASNSAKMPAAGLLLQTLAVNAEGYVVTGGYLRNLTTDTIDGTSTSSNDTVYVKSGGGLTMTKPTGTNLIQNIAKVARVASGNAGSLIVSSILRTNDVPNLTTGKIWVGSANNTIESGTLHLDESNNRLGIGDTTPLYALDVNGHIQVNNTIYGRSGADLVLQARASQVVGINSGGSRAMTLDASQQVGIGTTSPERFLHINSSNVQIAALIESTNTTSAQLNFKNGSTTNNGGFIKTTGDNIILTANNTSANHLVVASGGNVGIGTTSPNAKLDILGASSDQLRLRTAESEEYKIGRNSSTGLLEFYGTQSGYTGYVFSGVNGERMRIDSSGNIGVGVTPESWGTSGDTQVIRISTMTSLSEAFTGTQLASNFYFDGTNDKYILSDFASSLLQIDGEFRFRNASSGTAGANITWNERMRIESTGVMKFFNNATSTGDVGTIAHYTNNFMYIRGGTGGLALGDDGFDVSIYLNNSDNIIFNTGGTERMRITSDGDIYNYQSQNRASTYYGYNAGDYSATGGSNNAFGYDALGSVTTGNENVAMGRSALGSLTTGVHNVAVGHTAGLDITIANNNTLVGFNAGTNITTGSGNMCIGYAAGENITTSDSLVAIGYAALSSTTTSVQNTAVGHLAMNANTSGNYNSAIGHLAMRFNTTGSENHATGRLALYANSTGSYNVAVGGSALESSTTGNFNTAVGSGSIYSKTTGDANTAVGYRTLYLLGAGGTGNTAIGQQALQNTTSDHNVAIGRQALIANTTGNANVAVGAFAGDSNTTGVYNTYIGYDAGQAANNNENVHVGFYAGRLSTGGENTIIGSQAVRLNNSSATNTVAIGRGAMYKLSSGNDNTAVGHQAGFEITTAINNTLVGKGAGDAITTGSSNTAVGQLALSSMTTQAGNTALGRAAMQLGYGSYNVAVGNDALERVTGSRNTAVGYAAGLNVTSGVDNVIIGENTANNLTTGSYNTIIGRFAGETATAMSYATIIGRTAGRFVTSGAEPCFVGYDAGQQVTSGNYNTAIGTSAMTYGNGDDNTFVGFHAGFGQNGQSSSDNTAIGFYSMRNVSTGSYNTALGHVSLTGITTGIGNVALGRSTLYTNTTGQYNVAVGMDALYYSTTANNNVAVGASALQNNVTGTNSVAVGYQAGLYSTVGDNVYVGYGAGRGVTGDTGSANTFLGYGSAYNINGGTNNVAVGTLALYDLSSGTYNTGVGRDAGQNITTGNYNNLLGYNAGGSLTTAQYNTCMGHQAGQSTTTGLYNTMIGGLAGRDNTGQNNTYIGAIAGRFGTSGSMNTVVGSQAMDNQTFTGSSNTVMGFAAGQNITTGYDNIFLGKQAGLNSNTGAGNIGIGILSLRYAQTSGNIAIGYSAAGGGTMSGGSGKNIAIGDAAMYNVTSGQNNIAIGWNAGRTGSQSPGSLGAITTNSNEIQMGNTSHTGAYIQIGWTTVSDARDKGQVKDVPHGLDFVNQLQPKSFEFKPNRDTEETDGIERYGFLAQDVLQLEGENPVIVNNNDEDKLKMTNDYLVPVLVNAIKELKQEIENLKLQINN